MSDEADPDLSVIVAVWTMAFGQPPIVESDAGALLQVLRTHFPDVYAILKPEASKPPAA